MTADVCNVNRRHDEVVVERLAALCVVADLAVEGLILANGFLHLAPRGRRCLGPLQKLDRAMRLVTNNVVTSVRIDQ